jgi:hypothetical protein
VWNSWNNIPDPRGGSVEPHWTEYFKPHFWNSEQTMRVVVDGNTKFLAALPPQPTFLPGGGVQLPLLKNYFNIIATEKKITEGLTPESEYLAKEIQDIIRLRHQDISNLLKGGVTQVEGNVINFIPRTLTNGGNEWKFVQIKDSLKNAW